MPCRKTIRIRGGRGGGRVERPPLGRLWAQKNCPTPGGAETSRTAVRASGPLNFLYMAAHKSQKTRQRSSEQRHLSFVDLWSACFSAPSNFH